VFQAVTRGAGMVVRGWQWEGRSSRNAMPVAREEAAGSGPAL
jgi:hypothetical protein